MLTNFDLRSTLQTNELFFLQSLVVFAKILLSRVGGWGKIKN